MERGTSGKKIEKTNWAAWLRRAVLACLGMILGVELYMANARGIIGNALPMPFGVGTAVVLSGSMEPTFSKGDLVIVKKEEDPQVGDIIVYQSGKALIVHRVIERDGDQIVTQGDANNAADPAFELSAVKGKVVGWIPYAGFLAQVLKTPLGILAVLGAAFLLMEMSFRKDSREDEKELDEIREEIRKLKQEMKKKDKEE